MKEQPQTQSKPKPVQAPIYASAWVALYVLLRKEWQAPRSS
jgi:hypothetical protein